MAVLMIRPGEHPSDPPRTAVVLPGEVAGYERKGWMRVATDPGSPDPPPPPAARFNRMKFFRTGTTGD